MRRNYWDWCLEPTFEYEDEYVKAHADGSVEGKPIRDIFIYDQGTESSKVGQ